MKNCFYCSLKKMRRRFWKENNCRRKPWKGWMPEWRMSLTKSVGMSSSTERNIRKLKSWKLTRWNSRYVKELSSKRFRRRTCWKRTCWKRRANGMQSSCVRMRMQPLRKRNLLRKSWWCCWRCGPHRRVNCRRRSFRPSGCGCRGEVCAFRRRRHKHSHNSSKDSPSIRHTSTGCTKGRTKGHRRKRNNRIRSRTGHTSTDRSHSSRKGPRTDHTRKGHRNHMTTGCCTRARDGWRHTDAKV